MSKTPKARDWVYRFTYDDVVSVLGFDPDLDQLAVITKALDNSNLGEEFYTAVAGCVEGDIDEDDGEDWNYTLEPEDIPEDFEVQPLRAGETPSPKCGYCGLRRDEHPTQLGCEGWEWKPVHPTTCGTCELSWDDDRVTGLTPVPSARCPFEFFHNYPEDEG